MYRINVQFIDSFRAGFDGLSILW